MSNFDVLSAVQTRSGLKAVKNIWLDSLEKYPWADFSHIQENLWETDTITIPLFALKYTWNGSGKKNRNVQLIILISDFRSSSDFKYSTPFNNNEIEHVVRNFTPYDMMDRMNLDAAGWNATPFHDLYFMDDPNLSQASRPNQFAKWLIEKDNDVDVDEAVPGSTVYTI